MNTKENTEEQRVLELLDVLATESHVSQRDLARRMGVALGLANSYLKRCIRKGLIKITEAPANRYLYYLTPKGFAEKSRLTGKYLAISFSFYRKAGESCLRLYAACEARGWKRVLLCGQSDLAEIAALRAEETGIEVVGVYDSDSEQTRMVGRPVWRALEQASPHDGCVLTDLTAPAATLARLTATMDRNRILVPDILRLEQ
jgi:DNA-binding MarR family transcriptional regulator